MRQPGSAPRSRQQQRKERTRAALVRAAQALLAAGKTDVPIVEITQAADVGMGSFYNHFESKDQLFRVAVEDALDAHGALLEQLTEGLDDPAEVFACRFRLTGRLHRRQPQLSKVILHNALALAYCDCGLAPRARHDLDAAVQAGRFNVVDPELALAVVGAPSCASDSSCTTNPAATTPKPPTRSPRTCCACSASPLPKRAGSACSPCPISATRNRRTRGDGA